MSWWIRDLIWLGHQNSGLEFVYFFFSSSILVFPFSKKNKKKTLLNPQMVSHLCFPFHLHSKKRVSESCVTFFWGPQHGEKGAIFSPPKTISSCWFVNFSFDCKRSLQLQKTGPFLLFSMRFFFSIRETGVVFLF